MSAQNARKIQLSLATGVIVRVFARHYMTPKPQLDTNQITGDEG